MTPLSASLPRFCAYCCREIECTTLWSPDGRPYHPICHVLETQQVSCQSCTELKAEVARLTEALAAEREACAKIAEKYAGNHSMAALMTASMIAQAIRTGRSEGTP
jgi:hypothetical protein